MEILIMVFFILSVTFPVLHLYHSLPWFREPNERSNNREAELKKWMMDHEQEDEKGISILVPCFNETGILETSIENMKSLPYSQLEVLYINDGSTDDTLRYLDEMLQLKPCKLSTDGQLSYEQVKETYQSELYPNIYVIDKENGGKADALNAGVDYSRNEITITLDADTILEDMALPAVNDTFNDDDVVAAGGMVHVLQAKSKHSSNRLSLRKTNMLLRVQVLDFLKAFYISKLSLVRFKGLAVISGAFGIFRKQVLQDVGGYRKTIGEDIDITLRIHEFIAKHKNFKICFISDAVGYTELPETWKDLTKQRLRWQKAYIDCIIHFRSFFGKTMFSKAVSFFYVFEAFLIGTLASYIMTVIVIVNMINSPQDLFLSYVFFYMFWIFLFGVIYDVVAIKQGKHYGFTFNRKDGFRLFSAVIFDIFVYRFVTMYFVMYGSISYFFNKKWNKVSRTGRKYHYKDSKNAA
ncbi:glycosyltransferase family 2 protein [Halobacillus karajensis]|uniref:Poly-beta-1,6-N-acetyl-D-glucosamine synthase n=1 Tax=Halobacillus karajensis TaxID=195088 RepID=A0A024P4E5_9BACI|nr:glycosyltransferase family 2 protein [Halobacillus karajensis]CDQ20795.1 Poly-beta-1,6-N-acetyl-D-glucosamine synthase [Halobacillus karajensis]CDQ23735.1 Poly-beta-1,6-N-acetyl-D-glucosamine synthase [Halobacillus karajensis]CDQ27213.1 Poly-beta-1,6-N-acetyl-D-glucosamine synthase [Halobacillus karajensis]